MSRYKNRQRVLATVLSGTAFLAISGPSLATADPPPLGTDPPPVSELLEGYVKLRGNDGAEKTMYTMYYREKTGDILIELPPNYEEQRVFYGATFSGGLLTSGIQGSGQIGRWLKRGDRLCFVRPQLDVRTSGDAESQSSLSLLYPDWMFFDVPIAAIGEGGGPVIDLDEVFVDRVTRFFQVYPGPLLPELATFKKIKAYEDNFTVVFEMPAAGLLIQIAYSMSVLPEKTEFEPREPDHRVGYFATGWDDLAGIGTQDKRRRYIKRWDLRKADPDLALSPPTQPIVMYINHRTPIRYRRWVREGILEWNKAFEKAGILNAIEVRQQDARSGAYMDKDPENVRNNFFIWNSTDMMFAMGPSRIDKRTGQILDVDIVFNDGWIRYPADSYRKLLAQSFTEHMSGKELQWLDTRPDLDPHAWFGVRSEIDTDPVDQMTSFGGTTYSTQASIANDWTVCEYGQRRAIDLALARASLVDLSAFDDEPLLDGVPESFIGQQVKDVVMHEFGHILGLRHNFRASAAYTREQINSQDWIDNHRPISASVMDYNAVNYCADPSLVQGEYFMTSLGPYDYWAIQVGYGDEQARAAALERAGEPELAYLTDEDLYGPDPMARTRDLGKDSLDFVDGQMRFIQSRREQIVDRVLQEGDSFQQVRDAYLTILSMHASAANTALRHIGGIHINRVRAGDGDLNPTEPTPVAAQRRALRQVIEYVFQDDAFGLSSDLLGKMSYDKWFDGWFIRQDMPDPQLDVHDLVLATQASTLTSLFSPTRLRRICDTEIRIPEREDAFTIYELLDTVQSSIWSELDAAPTAAHTVRMPLISSLRRNLQREHVTRMIGFALMRDPTVGAAAKSTGSLAAAQLRALHSRIETYTEQHSEKLDPYSDAHLQDTKLQIERALDAMHVIAD